MPWENINHYNTQNNLKNILSHHPGRKSASMGLSPLRRNIGVSTLVPFKITQSPENMAQ